MTDEAAAELVARQDNYDLARAERVRDQYVNFAKGAEARAGHLPRSLIAKLAYGVTDLMLMEIINRKVKPKSAKEAIEVAKVALDIARRESGEADVSITIRSPEQRAAAMDRLKEMALNAQARKAIAATPEEPIEDAVIVDPDLEYAESIPQVVEFGEALL